MDRKRSGDEASEATRAIAKAVAARASPAIVSVVSHHVPEDMFTSLPGYYKVLYSEPVEIVFCGSGIILECQASADADADADEYLCTVLTPACLFKRPSNFNPTDIKIDVFWSTAILYNAKLLAWDFHYNLTLVQFISNSPLPTATFRSINDSFSIDPTDAPLPFQLRPHSKSFNIIPGTPIISVSRGDHSPPMGLYYSPGYFRSSCPEGFSCNELYEIEDENYESHYGGPVLNSSGEIIGVILGTCSFLPSNIVTRWCNHYKLSGAFRRPFLGVKVANLRDANLDFLAQFTTRFPKVSTFKALIVSRVDENSSAYCSGIRANDVIEKLDGKLMNSKLQFFETIWEKTGKSVEFNVLRVTDGKELNVNFLIQETSLEKFHQWPLPYWKNVRQGQAESGSESESESSP